MGIAQGRAAAKTAVYTARIKGCRTIDGDTLDCRGERIRLAIGAPELPSLATALDGQRTIDRVGGSRYGRTLARVTGWKGDLSC